ncbi:hypothetical protein [Paracoccus jiaweipingae]|uniref:hypothetical protein n=1 Tax=Paracoccus sp. p2-l61 TaxID=3366950 RepID=UPI0037962150
MTTTREIITDLRIHAQRLDGTHINGGMMTSTCRALRRGAGELERLLDELTYLRGFAEEVLAREDFSLSGAE